jgi:predicted ester cyclase
MAAHDCISHQPDGTTVTLDEWRRLRAELFNGFPDFNLTVEGLVARGDDAVVRWRVTGTHIGRVFGISGTNREIDIRGMSWLRFRAGRIVEGWDGWDVGGLVWYLTRPSRDESPAQRMLRPVER